MVSAQSGLGELLQWKVIELVAVSPASILPSLPLCPINAELSKRSKRIGFLPNL